MTAADHRAPAIFGAHAEAMRRAGLAVIPARGKQPIRKSFNRWRRAPGPEVIERWAGQSPDANIAYVPGLSKNRAHPYGLVVVDVDDRREIERAQETFGRTPAMIDTRRGRHLLYRAPAAPLGKISSLRGADLNADLKHGRGISIAPPSVHESGHVYCWTEGSGLGAIDDAPFFDPRALHAIVNESARQHETVHNATVLPRPEGEERLGAKKSEGREFFRAGSRKLALNDFLVAQARAIDDLDTALDIARTWNDDLWERHGIERLPDGEVLTVCRTIMADLESGRLERTHRQRAIAVSDADEIRYLTAQFSNGDSAHTLLMLLRAEHGARCRRGDTFALSIAAMAESQTMGKWSPAKYRAARDTLLEAGLIEKVRPAGGGLAAQYWLSKRVLTPSKPRPPGSPPA